MARFTFEQAPASFQQNAGGDLTGSFRAGMELGRYKNERADQARKQQTLADIIRKAKSEEEAVKMAASTGDTDVLNGVAAFIAKSDAAGQIASERALSDILANSIDISQTPGVQQATAVDDEGNVNPMVESPRIEANLSWDKAFANLAQADPRIRGKMALQLQKMRIDEEQARLKAVKESRIGLDYEDIKVTEDGRLIGRRKGTGQYEYMNLPEGARATQPPIMVDTGTGIVPMTRPDALRTARGGGIIPKQQQIPANALTDIRENEVQLQKIQDLLDATNPKPSIESIERLRRKGIKHDPNAFGAKTLTPNIILNRTDPSGVDARAIAADIGSMVIRDRSGAAVTAAEFPRLRPFIPSAGDDGQTVRKKIQGFYRVYSQIQDELRNAYSPERGFVPLENNQPVMPRTSQSMNSWEDGQYMYRRLPDGTVQRKRK